MSGLFDSYRLREGVHVWIKGMYQDGEGSARDLMRQGFDSHTHGFTLGVDVELAEAGLVGGYLAYDDLDVDYRGAQADTGNARSWAWTAGAYGSYWSPRQWFIQGSAGYGWHDLESRRDITFNSVNLEATGARDARNFAANAAAGFNISPGSGWVIQPQTSVSYDRFDDDAYTETGAGSLNLTMSGQQADTLRGEAGMTVRKSLIGATARPDIAVLYLYANYVYDHMLDDRSRRARFAIANTFEVRDTEETRHGIRYGLGFENTWHNNASVQVLFAAEDYGEIETLSGSLQFRKQF